MGMLTTKRVGIALAASGLLVGSAAARSFGDDPPRLSRLFRFGGNTRSADKPSIGKPAASPMNSATPQPYNPPNPAVNPAPGSSLPAYGPIGSTPPATTTATGSRIAAQPRVSHAATESEPLVTRVSIGRADDGKQFCMFIEIFADGTVMDSEGVHKVGPDQIRPIAHLLQSGELAKLKGHCGGPAADFVEQIHMVTYDRYHGRLRATPFSFSGNPQGCDPVVKKMNDAIDALQMKLAGPPATRSAGSPDVGSAVPTPTPTVPVNDRAPALGSVPIDLTPETDKPMP